MTWPKIGLFVGLAALLGCVPKAYSACDPTLTVSYTPRLGLAIPKINSCNWGNVTNGNWLIIDSSNALQSFPNTFISSQTFSIIKISSEITAGDGTIMMFPFSTTTNFWAGYGAGFPVSNSGIVLGVTGVGVAAGEGLGNYNTALGYGASGSSGQYNVVIGAPNIFAGPFSGSNNTAIGGNQWVSVGGAQADNTTIGYNIFTAGAGGAVRNTVVGSLALSSGTTASSNTVVGYAAGYGFNTDLSSAVLTGSGNTFFGYEAGTSTSAVINKSIAIGYGATVTSSGIAQIGGVNSSGSEVLLQVSSITTNQITSNQIVSATITGPTTVQSTPFTVIDPGGGSGNSGYRIDEQVAGPYIPNYQFEHSGSLLAFMGYSNNGTTGITFGGPAGLTTGLSASIDVGGSRNATFNYGIITATMTASSFIQFASKNKSQLAALTPSVVGQMYYCSDCATLRTCISTGTAQGAFSSPVSATTACN